MGLGYLPIAMALPFLPLTMRSHGYGTGAIGIAMGAEAITAVVVRPFAGVTALRVGGRRMFVLGSLLATAATVVNVVASSIAAFVAARLVLGIGSGGSRAVMHSWAVDVVPAERRGRALGLVGLVNTAAVAAGPPVGYVAERAWGYDGVWYVGGVAALLAAALAPATDRPVRLGVGPGLLWRGVRLSLKAGTGVAAGFAGYAAVASFAALLLRSRGVSGATAVLTAYGIALIVVRIVAGGAPDRFGPRRIALVSAGLEAGGLALIAFAHSSATGILGGILLGAGLANLYPALGLAAFAGLGAAERSVVAASLGSFVDVGIAVGAPAAGLLIAHGGYEVAFVTIAIAVAALVAVAVARVGSPVAAGHALEVEGRGELTPAENRE